MFDPAEITEIVIRRKGASTERLVRSADAAEWELVLLGADGSGETRWPVMTTQVRALLRVLSDLPGETAGPASTGETAAVTLKRARAGDVAFEVGDAAISGRVVMKTFDETLSAFWVDAQVAAALRREGVLLWRDRTLLRGIGPETSRVSLRGPGGALTAQRVLGKWGLTEPVAAAASQDAIERLVASLAALRAEEFVDTPPSGAMSSPSATATVTLSSRGADGAGVESTRTLEIGGASDLGGSRLYARVVEVGASGSREHFATLDAAALKNLTTDPVPYIDPRGATFPAADVGGVVLGGLTYKRTPRGWDGDVGPAPAEEAGVLSALVQVVTEHPASVALAAPAGVSEWRDLELRSLGGEPLARMQVGVGATGNEAHAVVRDGAVWRIYAAPGDVDAVRAALGLAER
jgi:hypothetical protein